jgi:cbb3-type cytochrome oxidase cytochrome c subunit
MGDDIAYKAFFGRHVIRAMAGQPHVLRGMTSKTIAARHVTFHGSCYYCGYASHSQMYCPLRWCKVCKQYGHSEAVCARLMPSLCDDDDSDDEGWH